MSKPKNSSTSVYIFNMEDRSHVAVNYSNSQQMDEAVINFTLRGIACNQINFWLVQRSQKEHWLEVLSKKGINVNQLIDSHELTIVEHKDVVPDASQEISFDPILKKLQAVKKLVADKQKFGINVIGTLAGSLFAKGKLEDCINIESHWHEIIDSFEIPITVLCPSYSLIEKYQADIIEIHNHGLITLTENSDIKRTLGNKEVANHKEESEKYQSLESDLFPKKELAIFNSLNEIISVMREKESFQKNEISETNKTDIPEWYFNLVESLNKLYSNGYDNAQKENESFR